MSFSHMRPQTSQLVELHVFYVPEEVWNFKLNTVPIALASKFISAGFIRVSPHITLRVLREKLGEYLGGVAVADKFKFLKCIGKKLAVFRVMVTSLNYISLNKYLLSGAFTSQPGLLFHNSNHVAGLRVTPCLQVKAKQETELELKSFAPPYALYPELYLLPEVEFFEDVYPLSSSPQQRHYFNADNRFGHGSRLFSLPQQKPEKSKPFLESIHSSHQLENQKVHSPVELGEKEPLPFLHTKHKQDYNNWVQEKHVKSREKDSTDENGCNGSSLTQSHSNPAHWESGESDIVLQASQQNHLSQDQKEPNTPKWDDKANGTRLTLHVNHSDERGQNNEAHEDQITHQKDLTNTENNDHRNDTEVRRDRTQDARILKVVEDQTTEYAHRKQSLQQYRASQSIADPDGKWDNQAGESKQNHLTCPKEYILPPNPSFIAVSQAQVPAIQTAKNKMVEQLQQMKKDRRHMEKTKEELMKKAKGLLEQNKLRRYYVREEWKKKYFETKKATVSLESALSKLQQEVELYHQKLLKQLEARDSRKRPNNMINSKNYTIIRITTVQHELDQLRRKLDDTKMKLIIEIKMRKQAASDLQALRAELTQKKIHSALILQSRKAGI